MDTRSSLGSGVGTCKLSGGLGAGWGCTRAWLCCGYGLESDAAGVSICGSVSSSLTGRR
eukprot:gene14038-biopygen16743